MNLLQRAIRDQNRLNEIDLLLSNEILLEKRIELNEERKHIVNRMWYRRTKGNNPELMGPPPPRRCRKYTPFKYTEEHKMSQRQAMLGYTHTDETIIKMKKSRGHHTPVPRVINTPIGEFESITKAAKALNITPAAVHHKLKHAVPGWTYIDRESTTRLGNVPGNQTYCRPIFGPDGTEYASLKHAFDAVEESPYFICKSLKQNDGRWRYKCDRDGKPL